MLALLHWPAISLFGRSQHQSSIPARFSTIDARFSRPGWPRCWRRTALFFTAARTMLRPTTACCLGILLTLGMPLTGRAEAASRAQALLPSHVAPVVAYAPFITEASHRFAIPARWIRAVMRVESGGNAEATSPKGALGLMQIMPET
jgi:Transglycosylase SLT domain